jgi:hypothetical protein
MNDRDVQYRFRERVKRCKVSYIRRALLGATPYIYLRSQSSSISDARSCSPILPVAYASPDFGTSLGRP